MNKQELQKRKTEMTRRARRDIAKTEIIQFRLDKSSILKLYELAEKNKKHVGTMVREWVLEKIENKQDKDSKHFFTGLPERVALLERKVNQLSKEHTKY
jgi:hypothetical protein